MERSVNYIVEADLVLVKTAGIYNMGKEEATLRRALEILAINNCKRIFIDHRDSTILIQPEIAFQRAELFDALGFSRDVKFAVVFDEVCGSIRFYEEIITNKGWQMKVCSDFDFALKWLAGAEDICLNCLMHCTEKAC